jgi:hypothetical protein
MAVDYQQQFQDSIVGSMMPNLNRQKKGMYDFLLQNALRTGQSATSVAEGLRPYAEASGQAAAEAGVAATGMARRAEEFDKQQALHRERMAQNQANWEKSFQQQQQAHFMNILSQGGTMTPEMMEAFGYDDMTRQQQREIERQMRDLGMGGDRGINSGFNRPNPALDRLYGRSGSGGSNFGSGGASSRSISTPSDPFRRVTGPGQGPGLMSLSNATGPNGTRPGYVRNSSGFLVPG